MIEQAPRKRPGVNTHQSQVILLGASVRALAMSCRRVGLEVFAVDLFGDLDLRRLGEVRTVSMADYPQGLVDALKNAPMGPVLYTGGLENHPSLIEEIGKARRVWGNSAEVLRQVRDPLHLVKLLEGQTTVCYPEIRTDLADVPADGSWLLKPFRSAAGHGICPWRGGSPTDGKSYYAQQRVSGTPISAIYNRFQGEGGSYTVNCFGVTEQLIGTSFLHAGEFHYAGNVVRPDLMSQRRFHEIGSLVGNHFGLLGLFGIDFLLDDQDGLHLLEVNPRYTASMELFEYYGQVSLLREHVRAFDRAWLPRASGWEEELLLQSPKVISKGIYYAPRDLERVAFDVKSDSIWQVPEYADVPDLKASIKKGSPVMTLFAEGENPGKAVAALEERALRLDARLQRGG